MTQHTDTTHQMTVPLLTVQTRAAGLALLQGADWTALLAVTSDLGTLADTSESADSATVVRRLIRLGRSGADWDGYGPDEAEAIITGGLRVGTGRPDVYLALLPILDAIRALRELAA